MSMVTNREGEENDYKSALGYHMQMPNDLRQLQKQSLDSLNKSETAFAFNRRDKTRKPICLGLERLKVNPNLSSVRTSEASGLDRPLAMSSKLLNFDCSMEGFEDAVVDRKML